VKGQLLENEAVQQGPARKRTAGPGAAAAAAAAAGGIAADTQAGPVRAPPARLPRPRALVALTQRWRVPAPVQQMW
jgi:hypothetical protein